MPQHKREPLTADELQRFEAAVDSYTDTLIAWTLIDTGLRVAEFCAITRADVDFQSHAVRVRGKGGKRRTVPLSTRVRHLLETHLAVVPTMRLTPRTVQRRLRQLANRAAISKPVSPHVLRHTFAVQWLRKGGDLRVLQLILGHASLDTTAIYLNLSAADVLAAYRRVQG